MNISSFQGNGNDFSCWDDVLSLDCDIHFVDSIISGKVKLNLRGTVSVDYEFIDDVPDVSFYMPVLSHILFHEKFGYFLVDAGLDKSYAANGFGRCRGSLLKDYCSFFIQEEGSSISDFIEEREIDLSGVFLTHTHVDHVSGIVDLDDGIPLFFSNREKSMDLKPFYYAEYFKSKKFIQVLDVDSFVDTPILGRCFDVFGDSSFYAIYTPGHTPGHLSYLLNGENKVLFAGDACYTRHGLKYGVTASDYTWNKNVSQKSLERILRFKDKYNINIIPGHSL